MTYNGWVTLKSEIPFDMRGFAAPGQLRFRIKGVEPSAMNRR